MRALRYVAKEQTQLVWAYYDRPLTGDEWEYARAVESRRVEMDAAARKGKRRVFRPPDVELLRVAKSLGYRRDGDANSQEDAGGSVGFSDTEAGHQVGVEGAQGRGSVIGVGSQEDVEYAGPPQAGEAAGRVAAVLAGDDTGDTWGTAAAVIGGVTQVGEGRSSGPAEAGVIGQGEVTPDG